MATLYMAWRGVDADQNLYWAVSFDGKWWSPQQRLNDRASTSPPALAAFQDKLFMAWRGVAGDPNLYWATYDGNPDLKWSEQHPLGDRASAAGPALAVFRDELFMAWRGVTDDQNLYWAIYDETDKRFWTDQRPLTDRASYDGPALGAFQDQLFMAWRGVKGDENLYWATYDENDPRGWIDQHSLGDRGSTSGPALAAFGNKLYMAWKGVAGIDENDERLFWATYDQSDKRGWTDQNIMERVSADQSGVVVLGSVQRPSLCAFQNSIFVAGVGLNIVSSAGSPDPGNSDWLEPGQTHYPQGPDASSGGPPPAPEPKGLFYTTFDGSIPTLPIKLFQDRASQTAVSQAVYLDIALSLRDVMSRHGFDPSRGLREFVRETAPGLAGMSPLPVRALTGF